MSKTVQFTDATYNATPVTFTFTIPPLRHPYQAVVVDPLEETSIRCFDQQAGGHRDGKKTGWWGLGLCAAVVPAGTSRRPP